MERQLITYRLTIGKNKCGCNVVCEGDKFKIYRCKRHESKQLIVDIKTIKDKDCVKNSQMNLENV